MRERDADDHAAHVLVGVVRLDAARGEENSLRVQSDCMSDGGQGCVCGLDRGKPPAWMT